MVSFLANGHHPFLKPESDHMCIVDLPVETVTRNTVYK